MPKKTKKSVGPEKPAKTLIQSTIKDMLRKKVSEKHHNLLDEDDVLQDDSNVEDDTNVEDVSMASLETVCIKNYEIKRGIILPEIFKEPNDITKWEDPFYKVSEFCVSEYRKSTNFKEVELKRLYFGSGLVSTLISKPHKRLYWPVFKFKYESAEQEFFLKNLAMLPNIKSKQDLKTYVDFYKKHGLKDCYINMNKNNPAKEYSDKMIENFMKTNSYHRVWQVMIISNYEVLESYYRQNNIQRPKLYSSDFTFDSFIQYSNIESIAKSELKKYPKQSQNLKKKLKKLYDNYTFKIKTDCFQFLRFNPNYEVVNVSEEFPSSSSPPQIEAQPSTSTGTNILSDFRTKIQQKVATKSDKRKPIADADVDLTLDTVEHVRLTDVLRYEEVATASSSTTVLNEDSDDEEDTLETIAKLLTTSSSFVICVRDIYQTQMYLTATDWRVNNQRYIYNFLKSNLSLEIIKYVKVFNSFTKEFLVELIREYLSTQNQQETLPTVVIQTSDNQTETSDNNIDENLSIQTTSVDSLNKDPHIFQIKQEPIIANQILDIIDISSDSDSCETSVSPTQTTINVLENVVFIDANISVTDQEVVDSLSLDCLVIVKEEQIIQEDCSNAFSEVEIVEIVEEIIEIGSDSERSESILCNELNLIDDKITTLNSDIYLKSAEQGDTQQETIIHSDPIATCSTNNDSKLEHSYNSITYQAHIDDQHESKKRKMAINTMNRIENDMNEPSAKRVANKENVTLRKNPHAPVVMPYKPSSRNIYIQDSSSDEILQPIGITGNIDFHDHIAEVLNHEYSVFLSSQIVSQSCDDEQDSNKSANENSIKVPSINFTNQLNSDVVIANQQAACFYVKIVGVRFQKDDFFKISLNIPQFNFYSIDIEDENIKTLLNLDEKDWTVLTCMLNMAITYNYVLPKKDDVTKSSTTNSNMFPALLDKFFETSTAFKTFYLNSTNNSLICYNAEGVPANLNIDLSSTIQPSILEAMKRLKANGSIVTK